MMLDSTIYSFTNSIFTDRTRKLFSLPCCSHGMLPIVVDGWLLLGGGGGGAAAIIVVGGGGTPEEKNIKACFFNVYTKPYSFVS